MRKVQERSAKLCLHVVILIRTTALLKKFDRHNDHHLSNERQNINEYTCRSRYDIRKPKMKPIYLGYLNPSFFFCKGINNYNVVFIKQV
jgi:hypothetical protein